MIKHKQQQLNHSSNETGFTIIESLVAMLVVATLLVTIAPVIVLSAATRVQSRRVELATQAARSFIDVVKTSSSIDLVDKKIVIAAPSIISIKASPRSIEDNLFNTKNMLVPKTSKGLYCFNKNRTIANPDCTSDLFYIQAAQIQVKDSTATDGYRLGVRVYRADVDFNKEIFASDANEPNASRKTQNPYAAGLGDRQAPLIEIAADISSRNTSFSTLCQRLGSASGTCN